MATTTELVALITQYATDHYEEGGWDVIVECWDEAEIAEQIGDADTLEEALCAFSTVIDVYSDRQADARNSAF